MFLVTVKAVVTLTFDPTSLDWKLPVGTTDEFTLGSVTVNSAVNDERGLPPVPSLTPGGDDAQFIKTQPTAHNAFRCDLYRRSCDIIYQRSGI